MFIHSESRWFEVGPQQDLWGSFVKGLQRRLAIFQLRQQVRKERQELAGLSEAQLRDIGISQEAALSESRRGEADIPLTRLAMLERKYPKH